MDAIPQYHFYKTKYGEELLIDLVELEVIKKYLSDHPAHYLTYYDITLITEGEGWFRLDDTLYQVKPGDVLFSVPNRFREWDTSNIINGYALIFEEEFLLSFFNDPDFLKNISFLSKKSSTAAKLSLNDEDYIVIRKLTEDVSCEIGSAAPNDNHILRAILYRILKSLDRIYIRENSVEEVDVRNRYIIRFYELLDIHYREFHSVRYYADKLCITSDYLNQLIHKESHISTKQVIRDRLIIEAKKLLLYTKISVSEISDVLHFESPSYFIRFFRKHTGFSPLNFRQKQNL